MTLTDRENMVFLTCESLCRCIPPFERPQGSGFRCVSLLCLDLQVSVFPVYCKTTRELHSSDGCYLFPLWSFSSPSLTLPQTRNGPMKTFYASHFFIMNERRTGVMLKAELLTVGT